MRTSTFALMMSLVLGLAVPAQAASAVTKSAPAATDARAAHQRVIRIPRTSTGPLSEDERFAIREAISNEAKNFRGGDVIVITATAAIIVLLGVIIIILLT